MSFQLISFFFSVFPLKVNTETSVIDLDCSPILKSKPLQVHKHLLSTDTYKYISVPITSQGLKFKISFLKALGQGLNKEIVSTFEFNYTKLSCILYLYYSCKLYLELAVILFPFVWCSCIFTLCSLGSTEGFLAVYLPCKRGAEYLGKGWAGGLIGRSGVQLNIAEML